MAIASRGTVGRYFPTALMAGWDRAVENLPTLDQVGLKKPSLNRVHIQRFQPLNVWVVLQNIDVAGPASLS